MTQAINLANFSNNLDASGQVSPSAFNTAVPLSKGGTNAATASAARTNLGLGTIATQNSNAVDITGGSIAGINDLAIADGGTGASTAAAARANLGLAINSDVLGYVAPGASGNVLRSNGSSWTSTPLSSIVGINMNAGVVAPNGTFYAYCGPQGKILIQISAHVKASYGNFGARTVGIQLFNGTVAVTQSLQTMEWDSRVSGDGCTMSLLSTNAVVGTPYAYTFYVASGPGTVDNGYFTWIGV